MPRYFFVVTGGDRVIEDDVGAVYEDVDQALRAAERVASDLSEGDPEFGKCNVQVVDEAGAVLGEVSAPKEPTRH